MVNITTMFAHIKGSVRDRLYPFQDKNRTEKVKYGGEISCHDYQRQPTSQVSNNSQVFYILQGWLLLNLHPKFI
jgi:hypothetical protein